MLRYSIAQNDDDLRQILQVQQQNLFKNISIEQQKSQGFVTVEHSFDALKEMNAVVPQIVAKDGDLVVGYALAMTNEMADLIPELKPMFVVFNEIEWQSRSFSTLNYYVMGQICVAESHRGLHIFDGLYRKHHEIFSKKFDICVTEVAVRNTRSMRAHERVGFQTIHTYKDHLDVWNVVVWPFVEVRSRQ